MMTESMQSSASFLYSPLDSESKEVRILLLQPSTEFSAPIICSFRKSFLLNPAEEPYQALSYTWGDLKTTSPISVEGHEFHATKNLEAALRHIRDEQDVVHIWVDAVCIDQKNDPERSQQVQLMRYIYSGAERVLVWLGEASNTDNSDLGMQKCEEWGSNHQDRESRYLLDQEVWGKTPFNAENWKAVGKILHRPYWRRRWIYQEVMLSKDAVVICGQRTTSWKNFLGLHMAFYQVTRKQDMIPHTNWTIMENSGLSLMKMFLPAKQGAERGLLSLLRLTSEMDCTNARDHIYSLMGLAGDLANFPPPDYSLGVSQVFTAFAKAQIEATKSLDVLRESTCRMRTRPNILGFPTWAADWRCQPFTEVPLSRMPNSAAAGLDVYTGITDKENLFTMEMGLLQLRPKGIACDDITHIAPTNLNLLHLPSVMTFLTEALKGKPHPTGLPLLKVLHYTLSLDFDYRFYTRISTGEAADPEGALCPEQLSEGFLFLLAYQYGFFHDRVVPNANDIEPNEEVDHEFLPQDYKLADKFPQLTSFKNFIAHSKKNESLVHRDLLGQTVDNLRRNLKGRSLFVTDKGYIGLAQPNIREGDFVVILFGCDTPLIIRDDWGEFALIDDCFVYGLMDGEAVHAAYRETEEGMMIDCTDFKIA